MLRHSLRTGFSFGFSSGIITTLGLIVGLHSGTHSQLVIVGGIMTIAIADAFSDALGIHISEESENRHTSREIWESTISTFFTKFLFAILFVVPILYLPLMTAIAVSIIWGLSLLTVCSYYIAKGQEGKPWKATMEHLFIALVVITITHYVGDWIGATFG